MSLRSLTTTKTTAGSRRPTQARTLLQSALAALPILLGISCAAEEDVANEGAAAASITEGQWAETDRQAYYTTSEGTQVMPWAWFLALEQASGTALFRENKNLERFGFLSAPKSAENPKGLPVGLVRDVDPKTGEWFGLTCAACHTGEVTYKGKTLRIDGGSSLFYITQFLDELIASYRATLADEAKFERFAQRVSDPKARDPKALRDRMAGELASLEGRAKRNRPLHEPGKGHIDPVGNIFNETICAAMNMPQNCTTPSAPLKYPHVWGITELDWVQANSLAHHPLARNFAQVMGTFGRTTVSDEDCSFGPGIPPEVAARGLCNVRTTARMGNLRRIEQALTALKAPKWPEGLLGPIDRKLAARGEALYRDADRCVSCHSLAPHAMTEPNEFGRTFVKTTSVPLQEIGTDPAMAMDFATRKADPGRFASRFQPTDIDAEGKVAAFKLVSLAVVGGIFNTLHDELGVDDLASAVPFLSQRSLTLTPTPAMLMAYKARPLDGIAFAGYYLHNGSVPSLYELLLPAAQRSKRFYIGNREYDPVHFGYVSNVPSKGTTVFDTTLPGFSNVGHEGHAYGTDLDESDRLALLEFLKTL